MRQFAFYVLALLILVALPVSAENNCLSWKCFIPPPYTCPYCDMNQYNGPSTCTTYNNSGFCLMSGYCDTGNGDECEETAGHHCTDMQTWTNFLRPRSLNEEWRLVQVKIRSQQIRHTGA